MLKGTFTLGAEPLPDVLKSTKMMSPILLPKCDFHSVFEGRILKEDPYSLPLPNLHERDIDSICYFPTSLTVAKKGIEMNTIAYVSINLKASIHFVTYTTQLNQKRELVPHSFYDSSSVMP